MTWRSSLLGLAWIVSGGLLGAVLFLWRTDLVNLVIPLLRWSADLVETRMDVAGLSVLQRGSEQLLELRLVSHHPIRLYGQQFPHMDVSATTLVTHAMQHFFIFGMALISGVMLAQQNGKTWQHQLCIVPLLTLGLLLSLMLDLPFTLLGSIEGLLLEHLAPDQLNQHPLVFWERFMTQGGRMVTALCISLLCLNLAGVRWVNLRRSNAV